MEAVSAFVLCLLRCILCVCCIEWKSVFSLTLTVFHSVRKFNATTVHSGHIHSTVCMLKSVLFGRRTSCDGVRTVSELSLYRYHFTLGLKNNLFKFGNKLAKELNLLSVTGTVPRLRSPGTWQEICLGRYKILKRQKYFKV